MFVPELVGPLGCSTYIFSPNYQFLIRTHFTNATPALPTLFLNADIGKPGFEQRSFNLKFAVSSTKVKRNSVMYPECPNQIGMNLKNGAWQDINEIQDTTKGILQRISGYKNNAYTGLLRVNEDEATILTS